VLCFFHLCTVYDDRKMDCVFVLHKSRTGSADGNVEPEPHKAEEDGFGVCCASSDLLLFLC
jgi:hypothetical protein